MPDYATENVRNIALVGHAGAGKTTLVESLLAVAGAVASPGSVERGTTVSDADPLEKSIHHSISASVVGLDWKGAHINFIDTPGSPDFLGQALAVLPAVETAALVVNAQTGIERTARQMMQIAGERGLCRLIIINRIDAEGLDLERLLEEIRASFGPECLALNLPSRGGASVADCFFAPAGQADFSSVEAAHDALVDQVVEVDEKLMALYLEQGEELDPQQLHVPFEAALREGHLIPICFVSAKSGAGLAQLLDIIDQLMPNPLEGNPPPFIREDESSVREFHAEPDPNQHVLAHVIKIEHDPFMGKLAVFRVHQGTVTRDSRLYVGDARKPFKTGNLFKLRGKERNEVDRCIPGDICAVAKVEEIHFDAVLHDSHDEDHIRLHPVVLPTPVFGVAVWATRHSDEQKLSEVLTKLAEEDPGLRVEQNRATHETVLWGLGDRHLQLTLEKMQQRYNLEVKTKPPSIAYRETIMAAAEGHCRHKKQTGGAGQFGEVFLRIAPLPRGGSFEFVNEIRGGAIPGSLVPAVEKGVRQALNEGAIAGYPMQDIQVTVYDGKTHPVDSKEIAFVIAGRKAFMDAVQRANPIVLEPIVELVIDAPSAAMGDITGDIAARRGRIQDTQSHSERVTLQAVAPLAELEDFPSKLKAMTGGEGNYSLQFSRYEPVPGHVQQRLAAEYRPVEEEA
ncbi:MAG TPA: elongation factor G [Nitrococcus sp.]|nr:elongation factor G [Nitrococcus sp.]